MRWTLFPSGRLFLVDVISVDLFPTVDVFSVAVFSVDFFSEHRIHYSTLRRGMF